MLCLSFFLKEILYETDRALNIFGEMIVNSSTRRFVRQFEMFNYRSLGLICCIVGFHEAKVAVDTKMKNMKTS